MRLMFAMLAAALALTSAQAQWFEVTLPADSWPTMLCRNTQDDYVYCANWGGDNVTVINGATNTVVTTILVGEEPHAVIYNGIDNEVLCLNEASKTVSVIDGTTNLVVATESLFTHPWDGIWCRPYNKVYVLGHSPDAVVVLDGATHAIDTTIAFPADPYGVCYDDTDLRVYVSVRADSTVRAIDCVTNAVVATIPVGPAPNRLCWNPQQNKVYTATADGNDSTVSIIDCATNTVAATLVTGVYPYRLGYDPDMSRVYVCHASTNAIAVIDGTGDTVVMTIPTTDHSEGMCSAPHYGHVFCTMRNDSVLVLNSTTGDVIARVPVGGRPHEPIYNATDNRVYTADYDGATVSILRGSVSGILGDQESWTVEKRAPTVVSRARLLAALAESDLALFDASGRAIAGPGQVRPGVLFLRAGATCRKVLLLD